MIYWTGAIAGVGDVLTKFLYKNLARGAGTRTRPSSREVDSSILVGINDFGSSHSHPDGLEAV
jgi:hypothetical protein